MPREDMEGADTPREDMEEDTLREVVVGVDTKSSAPATSSNSPVSFKTEKFKPEFAGQLNFYVTAVNKNMKDEQDNQTIGILICKDKDDVVAEYSLENISQPIGIAQYELTKVLSKEFESSLPTIEEIEEELSE